jgi:hypothetical protein
LSGACSSELPKLIAAIGIKKFLGPDSKYLCKPGKLYFFGFKRRFGPWMALRTAFFLGAQTGGLGENEKK